LLRVFYQSFKKILKTIKKKKVAAHENSKMCVWQIKITSTMAKKNFLFIDFHHNKEIHKYFSK